MAKSRRGFFITLEGPDGSGKSTQFKLLVARLKLEGFKVTATREPGGHPLAEKIRVLLLGKVDSPPGPEAELLLFLAARAQHVRDLIQPALSQGHIVVCERFSDSTYAYQVGGRGLSAKFVQDANRFATGGLKPDLTLLYELPAATGLRRAFVAKQGHDRMESEARSFQAGVRKGYRQLAGREPQRIKIVQGDRPLAAVTAQTWKRVIEKMPSIRKQCHAV